jgi:putative SOS response-associated peptidase YedK
MSGGIRESVYFSTMCGRFTLLSLGQFTDLFPWIRPPDNPFAARYNIAPSQEIAVVVNDGENQIDFYRWGLVPFWAKDPSVGNKMINARMESLADKPAYRNALRSRRCLIPADGFYEWKKTSGGGKTPMLIRLKSRRPFAFAGLWEKRKGGEGAELRTCTIITGPANELVRPIHDRMPAILGPEEMHKWLEPSEREPSDLLPLLRPFPAVEMEAFAVKTAVNSPANDTSACVEAMDIAADIRADISADITTPPRDPTLFDSL